ncbi:MAG: hypothetical protein U5N58_14150 [Actinomycetota bacterium]|nr:hypothetical protein [Actinomycetota bacterium]
MLVAETGSGKIHTIYRTMEITRIGKNLDKTKMISKASAARTVRVLKEFKQCMEDYRVQSYRAIGTRALRMANNRQWFLDYAASEASINLEIISGQQEAFLSYRGATAYLDVTEIIKIYNHDSNDYLVMDIGGGSTELVVGSGSDPIMDISMDMGCVSLKEKFANDYRHMEKLCARVC